MRQVLLFLLVFIQFKVLGQNTIKVTVLSIGDNKPVTHFVLKTGRKQFIVTDSTGTCSISTSKSKIKLSFQYTMTKSKDTTIFAYNALKNVVLFTYLTWDSTQAKYDIDHNDMKLFCCFGFLVSAQTQKDKDFEKEFGVKYYIMGDAPPAPIDKLRTYNIEIGKYLDKRYGTEWRKKAKAYL
jgi:hypothetical protein